MDPLTLTIIGVLIAVLALGYTIVFGGQSVFEWRRKRLEQRQKELEAAKPIKALPQVDYLDIYLRGIVRSFRKVNFKGVGSQISHKLSVDLNAVFVPTSTIDPSPSPPTSLTASPQTGLLVREKISAIPLSTLLKNNTRLVVLGRSGGGKTTFMTYVALSLAESILNKDQGLTKSRLLIDWQDPPIPIYLPLRDFAHHLSTLIRRDAIDSYKSANTLTSYLTTVLSYHMAVEVSLNQTTDAPSIDSLIHQLIREGRCLFLLDSLDEMPEIQIRTMVVEIIEDFVRTYPKNHYVVSTRPDAYSGDCEQ